MNGNSSAQLESAELGSRSCEGNAFRRGGKIVGYTSNLPKAMRMLFNNNCNRNSNSNRNNNNLETLGQLLKSALLIDVECCGFGYDIWYQNTTNNPMMMAMMKMLYEGGGVSSGGVAAGGTAVSCKLVWNLF
ncbi:uncharacterized protein LOC116654695 [Drosophila ananassae]|uniref:uncharacterized protein LOC116654695 n=1 Tax=Drosophila ananassae TaxID=7217 RepID=UPI0013A5C769|nr:uncharacterized protein LOC116654695 [Drosophila ananassae]